jgi:hypothetical protein
MNRLLGFALAMGLCFAAAAQQYRWVDLDGRVQYGDTPPPGVKATRMRGGAAAPVAPAAPAAAGAEGKPAAKGPLSPAEQEAAFRQRQQETQKQQETDAQAARDAAQKKDQCARAQDYLRSLEGGQRIARTDSKGERYFLDEAQTAQELATARQGIQQNCN